MLQRSHPRRLFSVISNQRNPLEEAVGNRIAKYDAHIERYRPSIRAYLTKRKLKKAEIWPKMRIVPNAVRELEHDLSLQRLCPMKQELDVETMDKLFQQDMHRSSYIISLFTEKHLKQLLDEYVAKVVICGRTVPMESHAAYWKQREQIVALYRTFFFGEPLSPLEKEIQLEYLVEKQQKALKFEDFPENGLYRCSWTDSNQRCIELYKNWQSRPVNEFGDFREIFEPLDSLNKLPQIKLMHQIDGQSFLAGLKFRFGVEPSFERDSKSNLDWIVEYNMLRIVHWCNSLEFVRVMRIPLDFQVEMSVVHFHAWLLIDRLKQERTTSCDYLAKRTEFVLDNLLLEKIGKLSIKKKNDYQRNLTQMLRLGLNILDYHFNKSPLSKDNPAVKIDGLVWSIIYQEKIQRYSDEVYLFGEYAIKTYEMLKNTPIEKIKDCLLDFDAYAGDYDYREKLQAINPPLSEDEYQRELESDKATKKYYYTYDLPKVVMPWMNPQSEVKTSDIRRNNFLARLSRLLKKYYSLGTYDYFNQVQKQQKELSKQQKTGWKTAKNAVADLDRQFDAVQKIKRSIKK